MKSSDPISFTPNPVIWRKLNALLRSSQHDKGAKTMNKKFCWRCWRCCGLEGVTVLGKAQLGLLILPLFIGLVLFCCVPTFISLDGKGWRRQWGLRPVHRRNLTCRPMMFSIQNGQSLTWNVTKTTLYPASPAANRNIARADNRRWNDEGQILQLSQSGA